jgi:site-specific DNA-cytosine methylase
VKLIDCQGLGGAFTLGAVRAGFELEAKYEQPGGFGVQNCTWNHHLLGRFEVQVGPQPEWEPCVDVVYLLGNPPCSGFSPLNTVHCKAKKGTARAHNPAGVDSPINDCMWDMMTFASRCKGTDGTWGPDAIAMESVQQAGRKGRPLMQRLHAFVEHETGAPYTAYHVFCSGASAGAAAVRNRYFLVLLKGEDVRFGVEVVEPPEGRAATWRDAFGDLVGLKPYWLQQARRQLPSPWAQRWVTDTPYITAHIGLDSERGDTLPPGAQRMVDVFPWWEPGQGFKEAAYRCWDETGVMGRGWQESNKPTPDSLNWGFSQPRRIVADKEGFVITGSGGTTSFVHWEEDRFLTIREIARLQGFPDSWSFAAAKNTPEAANWIGKGVPVQTGYWISKWIKRALQGEPGTITGEPSGDRERTINVSHLWKKWRLGTWKDRQRA